jgi:putative addiction module antidote
MHISIRKIGNSEGVIIPKEVLNRHGLKAGDMVELTDEAGQISLRPVDDEFARQIDLADRFMNRYETALKKLAE